MIPLGVLASARVAASGGSDPAVTLRRVQVVRNDQTTTTFAAGADIGADTAARVLVIAVTQRTQTNAPDLTVGGSAATLLASVGTWHYFTFAYPTGATLPSVVATWPSHVLYERAIVVWTSIGTPTAGASAATSGATVTASSGDYTVGAALGTETSSNMTTSTETAISNAGWYARGGVAAGAGSWSMSASHQYTSALVLTY